MPSYKKLLVDGDNVSKLTNDAGYITSVGSVSYNDLTNKPTLFDGNYNSLTNKPSLFDGNYNSLSNKPTIPTNNNQLTNGAGFITGLSYSSLTSKPTHVVNSVLAVRGTSTPDTAGDNTGATFNYSASSATNKPPGTDHSLMTMAYSANWQTQIAQDWRIGGRMYVRGQNNGTWSSWYQQWSEHDFSQTSINNWQTAYGWGDHSKSGYLTSHQSLSGYATQSWVQNQKYLTSQTDSQQLSISGSTVSISGGNSISLPTYSNFSGSYDDLTNKPTIPGNTSHLVNDAGFLTSSGIINYARYGVVNDTRNTVVSPYNGGKQVRWDFKGNSADGLSDGNTYHGVMQFNPWSDSSGGASHQIGFTDNNNIWTRVSTNSSTWGSWVKQWSENHFSSTQITNWHTAYGWGDHSKQGYLTSHQDISGKANLSGATFTGNINTSTHTAMSRLMGHPGGLEIQSSQTDYGGIYLSDNNGDFVLQMYGSAHNNYGFLSSEWGAWDWRKQVNGKTYDNNQTTYYIQTNATTNLHTLTVANTITSSSQISASGGNSSHWNTAYGWGNHADAKYSTFSGSYNDLSNKPTIPTNNNQLTNGAGYLTSHQNISGKANLSGATFTGQVNVKASTPFLYVGDNVSNNDGGWDANIMIDSGSHSRLRLENRNNNKNLLLYSHANTSEPHVVATDSATKLYVGVSGTDSYWDNSGRIHTHSDGNSGNWNTAYGWGNHASAGYLTSHQSLSGYATQSWVQNQKYSTFSGSYNDLSNKPTIPSLSGYATQSWVTSQGYTGYGNGDLNTYLTGTGINQYKFSLNDYGSLWASDSTNSKSNNNPMSLKLWYVYNDYASGSPSNYGTILDIYGQSGHSRSHMLFGQDQRVYTRSTFYNQPGWNAWKTLAWTTDIPTNNNQLTNGSGYLTSHQSLSGYATESWVEGKKYLTSHQSLSGYATQSWVNSQGFLKSQTDSQTLSISGKTLTISSGNSITLPTDNNHLSNIRQTGADNTPAGTQFNNAFVAPSGSSRAVYFDGGAGQSDVSTWYGVQNKAYSAIDVGQAHTSIWTNNTAGSWKRMFDVLGDHSLVRANVNFQSTGTITASGGDSTSWNSAYTWGDHSKVGYLTSHQSLSGYATLSGTGETFTTNKTFSSNIYIGGNVATDNIVAYRGTDTVTIDAGKVILGGTGHQSTPNIVSLRGHSLPYSGGGYLAGEGFLEFDSYVSWTGAQRRFAITNAYGQDWGSLAFLMGNASDKYPRLTTNGAVDSNTILCMRLKGNNLIVGGQVDASGGNSGNWNTAYGWGNHGSAGYLTSHQSLSAYATKASPTFTGQVTIGSNNRLIGGFGAVTTAGTLDWNHSSNAISGSGYTLLLGNATNGPEATSNYYHPFTFEYSRNDGYGNMTQFAIPYYSGNVSYRTRYSGSWSGWKTMISSGNISTYADKTPSWVPSSNPNYLTSHQSLSGYLTTSGTAYDSSRLSGLSITSGTVNNQANRIVRTDGNGYLNQGWIHTTSGSTNATMTRIYASYDGYIRYYTPAEFGKQIGANIQYSSLSGKPTIPTNNNQLTNGAGYKTTDTNTTYTAGTGMSLSGTTFNCTVVNTDTNTTYSAGTGVTLSGTQFSIGQDVASNADVIFKNTQANGTFLANSTSTFKQNVQMDRDLTVTGTVTYGKLAQSKSDRRLKKDIQPLETPLDKVSKLEGKKFKWKDDNAQDFGVIAQEVEKVLPELTSEDKEGYKSVNYQGMIPYLIESIKELKNEVETLKSKCKCKTGECCNG